MYRPAWAFAPAITVLAIVLLAFLVGAGPALSPQEGLLLLRNGEVIRGRITHVGDRYVVTRGTTSELRIPVSAVEFRCQTLDQAYQHKRQAIRRAVTAGPHLQLAQWCLRHGLISAAADQLLQAMEREPKHPQLEQLERQIQTAARPTRTPRRPTPASDPPSADPDQSDLLLIDLPAGSVEQYTNVIQPMLINRCGTNQCHGPRADSALRLFQPPRGTSISRRFTERNLATVLGLVDRDAPRQSRLLKAPLKPHGGSPLAIFSDVDDDQFAALAAWVQQVSPQQDQPEPKAITQPDSLLLKTGRTGDVSPSSSSSAPGQTHDLPPRLFSDAAEGGRPYQARDPFDPEIFNRRFLSDESDER